MQRTRRGNPGRSPRTARTIVLWVAGVLAAVCAGGAPPPSDSGQPPEGVTGEGTAAVDDANDDAERASARPGYFAAANWTIAPLLAKGKPLGPGLGELVALGDCHSLRSGAVLFWARYAQAMPKASGRALWGLFLLPPSGTVQWLANEDEPVPTADHARFEHAAGHPVQYSPDPPRVLVARSRDAAFLVSSDKRVYEHDGVRFKRVLGKGDVVPVGEEKRSVGEATLVAIGPNDALLLEYTFLRQDSYTKALALYDAGQLTTLVTVGDGVPETTHTIKSLAISSPAPLVLPDGVVVKCRVGFAKDLLLAFTPAGTRVLLSGRDALYLRAVAARSLDAVFVAYGGTVTLVKPTGNRTVIENVTIGDMYCPAFAPRTLLLSHVAQSAAKLFYHDSYWDGEHLFELGRPWRNTRGLGGGKPVASVAVAAARLRARRISDQPLLGAGAVLVSYVDAGYSAANRDEPEDRQVFAYGGLITSDSLEHEMVVRLPVFPEHCLSLEGILAARGSGFVARSPKGLFLMTPKAPPPATSSAPPVTGRVPEALRTLCQSTPSTCWRLAERYFDGDGLTRDVPTAVQLVQKSCDAESPTGCRKLARLYQQGIGVKRNKEQARAHFQKTFEALNAACDRADYVACTNLGYEYFGGEFLTVNRTSGAEYSHKACDGGSATGCYNLIVNKLQPKNPARARQLLEASCHAGDSTRCRGAILMVEGGKDDAAKDSPEVAELRGSACKAGDWTQCERLILQIMPPRP